jgi:predicted TPR repeat methyltransferase
MFQQQLDDQGRKKDIGLQIQGPYPHILAGKNAAEVEMFLRSELIGEKELVAVIDQLRVLGKKESIMANVEGVIRNDDDGFFGSYDLNYASEHIPQTSEIHNFNYNPIQRKIKKSEQSIACPSPSRIEKAINIK